MTNPEHVLERYVADLQKFGTSTDKEEIVLYAARRIKDLEQELESVKDLVKRQNEGWGKDRVALHYLREAAQATVDEWRNTCSTEAIRALEASLKEQGSE